MDKWITAAKDKIGSSCNNSLGCIRDRSASSLGALGTCKRALAIVIDQKLVTKAKLPLDFLLRGTLNTIFIDL